MQRQLVLGSSSKSRLALLQRLQLPFDTAAPDVDETPLNHESPAELVYRLAVVKARAVALKYPDAIIIAADQVGVLNDHIFGKPLTHENAIKQLQEASGKRQQFFTGLCLFDARNKTQQVSIETFDVVYRTLTLEMIKTYLRKEKALECAGSCNADGLGVALVEEFYGKDFSSLIGLPLIRLVSMLKVAGIDVLS